MLKCKDFYAEDRTQFLEFSRNWEPIDSILERVNAWISSAKIKVLNVETVISSFSWWSTRPSPDLYSVRVWYEE
jgi:hypothetical protein